MTMRMVVMDRTFSYSYQSPSPSCYWLNHKLVMMTMLLLMAVLMIFSDLTSITGFLTVLYFGMCLDPKFCLYLHYGCHVILFSKIKQLLRIRFRIGDWKYLHAIARNRGIAAVAGEFGNEIVGTVSIVCWTVIVCRKSEGKLMFCPGSFFRIFSLDRLKRPFRLCGVGVLRIIKYNSRCNNSISRALSSFSRSYKRRSCNSCCNWARFKSSSRHRSSWIFQIVIRTVQNLSF